MLRRQWARAIAFEMLRPDQYLLGNTRGGQSCDPVRPVFGAPHKFNTKNTKIAKITKKNLE